MTLVAISFLDDRLLPRLFSAAESLEMIPEGGSEVVMAGGSLTETAHLNINDSRGATW